MFNEPQPSADEAQRPSRWWIRIGLAIAAVVVVAGVTIGILPRSPVPHDIRTKVSFPVYYPDQSKLPQGYTLDTKSFHLANTQGEAVVYRVTYGTGQKLVFSVQPKPSDDDMANFVKQYIPIHRQVLTLSGTATEGAIGTQTVVSLPASSNAWLIITGPSNAYATDNLTTVLKSIRKP